MIDNHLTSVNNIENLGDGYYEKLDLLSAFCKIRKAKTVFGEFFPELAYRATKKLQKRL